MDFYEKTVQSKEIYNGRIIRVRVDQVELPSGLNSQLEIVEHSGGIAIIAVTPEGQLLMVEQYRKPVEQVLLELPAGKLESGEEPRVCARRELSEETGYQAGKLDYLFSFYTSPGFSNELLHLFRADDLQEVEAVPDQDELLKVVRLNKDEIIPLLQAGKIRDGKTITGLLYYLGVGR